MKLLLVAVAAATLVLTASCAGPTPRPDEALRAACWSWSTSYLETVLGVARTLREERDQSAAFLIGDDTWPSTAVQRVAIGNAGYHACMAGMAGSFDIDSAYHVACDQKARDQAAGQTGWILLAQAQRAALDGTAPPGPMPAAQRAAALYGATYDTCMAVHVP